MKRLPSPSRSQVVDTGMVLTLLMLLLGIFTDHGIFYRIVLGFLLVNMTFPRLYQPVARVWFALAQWLSMVSSRIVLTLLFVVFVIPVGWWRRKRGKDPLRMTSFKQGSLSVMKTRDHWVQPTDLDKPY